MLNDIIQKILDLKQSKKFSWALQLKSDAFRDTYEKFLLMVPKPVSGDEFSLATKLYWTIHDLHDFPACSFCSSSEHMHKNVDSFERGYFRACCSTCPEMNRGQVKVQYR